MNNKGTITWIPVSERLPEAVPTSPYGVYSEEVFVSNGTNLHTARYNTHKSYWHNYDQTITIYCNPLGIHKLSINKSTMRVTKKLLKNLVDSKLKELQMPFEVESIERSRFRAQDYDGGAWRWKANLKATNGIKFIVP